MKKTLSTLCALAALAVLLLGSASNPDGSCNVLWTLGCLAVSFVLGYAAVKLNPEALR